MMAGKYKTKKNMKHGIRTNVLVITCLAAGACVAAEAVEHGERSWEAEVGVVAAINTSYYRGVGSEEWLLPLVMVEYGDLYIHGVEAGYRLWEGGGGETFSIEGGITFDGYESGDAPVLVGMSDRESALEVGFVYRRVVASGELEIGFRNDMVSSHDGYSVNLEYGRKLWGNEKHRVDGYAGLEYWNEEKTDYYFGVRETEARSWREAYRASDTVHCFVGLNAVRKLGRHYSLIISAEYRTSGDTVSDSPLVTRNDQLSAYIGIFRKL